MGVNFFRGISKFGYFISLQIHNVKDNKNKSNICNIILKSGNLEQVHSKTSGWMGGCSKSRFKRIAYSNKKSLILLLFHFTVSV